MSAAVHRAPKAVTPRKATAAALAGSTAGSVALSAGSSQALTLARAKAQYQADEGKAETAGQVYDQQEQAYAQLSRRAARQGDRRNPRVGEHCALTGL